MTIPSALQRKIREVIVNLVHETVLEMPSASRQEKIQWIVNFARKHISKDDIVAFGGNDILAEYVSEIWYELKEAERVVEIIEVAEVVVEEPYTVPASILDAPRDAHCEILREAPCEAPCDVPQVIKQEIPTETHTISQEAPPPAEVVNEEQPKEVEDVCEKAQEDTLEEQKEDEVHEEAHEEVHEELHEEAIEESHEEVPSTQATRGRKPTKPKEPKEPKEPTKRRAKNVAVTKEDEGLVEDGSQDAEEKKTTRKYTRTKKAT